MQEETTQKTIALAIKTSKLTASVLQKAMKMYLEHQKHKEPSHGKIPVKKLVGQGAGAKSIEVTDDNIKASRMHGIPSIGVNMHIEGTEEWEDEQADIVSGKRIDVDFLNYTPELRDTPKVQDAIKKLIAAYPEKDVIDMETKEQKIQTLAAELDQLSYEIDTYGYRDSVSDRESQIQMIADDIRTGNVKPLSIFLQASIDEGIDEDSERQAKELLVKLAEYKPLAKIEELEEQNYNMIDERLNNGVEKFNREEEKKEQQEKPQARSSLKERLAAKQKEATQGNNKDTKEQEKSKNSHREM